MGFSTFPNNPFPPSSAQFEEGKNDFIQAEIDAIKDGTSIDSFGDVETALASKTNLSNIAPTFDATSGVYAVGDKVIEDGVLYEFTSAHSTAGEWDESEVQPVKVSELIDSLKSGLIGLSSNVVFEPQTAPSTSNPFGDDGTGYILKVKYNGVTLGYLVIRSKNYVDTSTSRKVALELFDNSWSKIWDIVRDNT